MKKTAYNPYLPGNEYVPDAEPRVFRCRVYGFGSHDRAGGTAYCLEDSVGWSAPVMTVTTCSGRWKLPWTAINGLTCRSTSRPPRAGTR